MSLTTVSNIQASLSCGRPHCECGRLRGDSLTTHCPAHDDGRTSLSVTGNGGRLLVKCHAGCSQEAVIDALKSRDLWPKAERTPVPEAQPSRRRTAAPRREVAAYDYRDEDGALLYQVLRMEPKGFSQRAPDPAEPNGWRYRLDGVRRVLFRLPELLASGDALVFIAEGEKDANRLISEGLIATTNAGGAGKWQEEYTHILRGRDVAILPDNDEQGRAHAQKVASALQGTAKSIRIVELPDLPPKGDVSDWLESGRAIDDLLALASAAPPWASEEDKGAEKPPGALSELALATAWANQARDEFLYIEGDQWWRYEAGLWHYSSLEAVQAEVQRFLTQMKKSNDKIHVTRARVQNVVFLSKSLLGPLPLTVFDNHPEWIPLRNGVFDIAACAMLQHGPERRLTHLAPYDYDADARCPRWETFLQEVMLTTDGHPHSEWINIVQEWFGYCLIPDTSAQAAMFWVGEGQNGKGTATRVLEQLVGRDYCMAIPIEQLHDPYYRAALHGKLVGLVNEPDPRAIQKNGTFFKALTGGDTIDARRPTEKVFSFTPQCRLIISCNDLPATRDVSKGYFRRIILIEWRYNVPNANRSNGLDDILRAELPGIFNWAVIGLRRWMARSRAFDIPSDSVQLLDEYRMGEDTLARFLDEETARDAGGFATSKILYGAYVQWCKQFGERHDTMASVGRRLAKMGLARTTRRIGASTAKGWEGIVLNAAEESETGPGLPGNVTPAT